MTTDTAFQQRNVLYPYKIVIFEMNMILCSRDYLGAHYQPSISEARGSAQWPRDISFDSTVPR